MVTQSKRNSLRTVFPYFFLTGTEKKKLSQLIGNAELKTSAEIRVRIERRNSKIEIIKQAHRAFTWLGMQKTSARNGVLILVCPDKHEFAVIGDQAIDEKVPADYWKDAVRGMEPYFKDGRAVDGIQYAIEEIGKELVRYFPRSQNDQNELSDKISS